MKKSVLFMILSLAACATNPNYIEVADLSVNFIAPTEWNGDVIPARQTCRKEAGRGATPALFIKNIPENTNLILLEINDTSNPTLANAGLGTIGFYHDGRSTATLLPVSGETYTLPPFAFEEKASKINPAKPYPYFPPCHFKKHTYTATIKAVKRTGSFDKQKTVVLGTGKITLGTL